MKYIERNGLRILQSDFGYLLHNKVTDSYSSIVYLGKFASLDDYKEVQDKNIDQKLVEKVTDIEEENINQSGLIDITMLAIDEMFILFEPILISTMSILSINERGVKNPMIELYVVMIQRGLKTIDQVPERYRADVQELLDAVE